MFTSQNSGSGKAVVGNEYSMYVPEGFSGPWPSNGKNQFAFPAVTLYPAALRERVILATSARASSGLMLHSLEAAEAEERAAKRAREGMRIIGAEGEGGRLWTPPPPHAREEHPEFLLRFSAGRRMDTLGWVGGWVGPCRRRRGGLT
jgi:hypothetical protein